jgi:hypothetical protein
MMVKVRSRWGLGFDNGEGRFEAEAGAHAFFDGLAGLLFVEADDVDGAQLGDLDVATLVDGAFVVFGGAELDDVVEGEFEAIAGPEAVGLDDGDEVFFGGVGVFDGLAGGVLDGGDALEDGDLGGGPFPATDDAGIDEGVDLATGEEREGGRRARGAGRPCGEGFARRCVGKVWVVLT